MRRKFFKPLFNDCVVLEWSSADPFFQCAQYLTAWLKTPREWPSSGPRVSSLESSSLGASSRVQGRTRTSTHSNVLRAGEEPEEGARAVCKSMGVRSSHPRIQIVTASLTESRTSGRGKKGDDLTGSRSLEDNGRLVTMNQPLLREHQMKFPSTAADGTQRCAQLDSSAGEAGSVPSSVT